MPVQFKKYDVVKMPCGTSYLILDSAESGKVLCLNDNTLRLVSELSQEEGIEVIGRLSMFDVVRNPSLILLSMAELLVLLDCALGSLNDDADEDWFHYDSSERENVKDEIIQKLSAIKLRVSDV